MVVFKEDHFSIRDDRSHVCVFAEQLQPLSRVEVDRSFELFQFFDECFSGSHALHFAIRPAAWPIPRKSQISCVWINALKLDWHHS
jgi:hypothetical protein